MKEETAIVLEYLPNGYPLEKKMMPFFLLSYSLQLLQAEA